MTKHLTEREALRQARDALATAARRFEFLAAYDDTERNGACPSAGYAECVAAVEEIEAALAKPDSTIKVNSAGTVAVAQGVFWLPIDKHAPLGVRLLLINKAAGRATDGQLGSHEKFFDHYQAFPKFKS